MPNKDAGKLSAYYQSYNHQADEKKLQMAAIDRTVSSISATTNEHELSGSEVSN